MTRRGTSMVECTLALAITAVAMALFAQILVAAAAQRRIAEQRRIALTEVANRLEQASLLAWDEITQERLEQLPLSAAAEILPEAELAAIVSDEPGTPRGRRIRIELSWTNAAGQRQPPVSLTYWRFGKEDAP